MICSLHILTIYYWIYCIKYLKPIHPLIKQALPAVKYDRVRNDPQMNRANTGRRWRRKREVYRFTGEHSPDTDLIFCVPNASLLMTHSSPEQTKNKFFGLDDWHIGDTRWACWQYVERQKVSSDLGDIICYSHECKGLTHLPPFQSKTAKTFCINGVEIHPESDNHGVLL